MRRSRSSTTRYGSTDERADMLGAAGNESPTPPANPAAQVDHRSKRDFGDSGISESSLPEPRICRRNKFSAKLIAEASAIFSRRLGRPVSEGEARTLLGDLTDYYQLAVDRHRATRIRRTSVGKEGDTKI